MTKYFLGEREFLVFPHCDAAHSMEIDEFLSRKILQNFFNFLREINAIKVLFSKMASENSALDQVRANLRKNDFTKS